MARFRTIAIVLPASLRLDQRRHVLVAEAERSR
jgi:hypothetical protein